MSSKYNLHYEKIGKETRCIEDEIPFEIPKSWSWVRLGEISSLITDGTHKTPTYVSNGIPFLTIQNISKGFFDFSTIKYISKEEHECLCRRVRPQQNDILFCRIGTLGEAIKCTLNFDFNIFVSLGLIRLLDARFVDYVVKFINSSVMQKWIEQNKVGGGTHTFKINLGSMYSILLPLPPLSEQKRIVDKLEEILPLVEKYKENKEKLDELNLNFPSKLKKSILDYAIKGKLVEQNLEDESVEILLQKIRQEKQRLIKDKKIKADKFLQSTIFIGEDNSPYEKIGKETRCIADEIPFEIPQSWSWVRLG
ncbi:restriction endonuclease subunit S, partial [Campylobacter concisus]|uniref:restriction endonuclease subunit S n=1 Tax=Campylobacter concisus TaxID=199 RepID=UPI0015E15FBC